MKTAQLSQADLQQQEYHAILEDLIVLDLAVPGLNPFDRYAAPIHRLAELGIRMNLAGDERKARACMEAIQAVKRCRDHHKAGYRLISRHIKDNRSIRGALAIKFLFKQQKCYTLIQKGH